MNYVTWAHCKASKGIGCANGLRCGCLRYRSRTKVSGVFTNSLRQGWSFLGPTIHRRELLQQPVELCQLQSWGYGVFWWVLSSRWTCIQWTLLGMAVDLQLFSHWSLPRLQACFPDKLIPKMHSFSVRRSPKFFFCSSVALHLVEWETRHLKLKPTAPQAQPTDFLW